MLPHRPSADGTIRPGEGESGVGLKAQILSADVEITKDVNPPSTVLPDGTILAGPGERWSWSESFFAADFVILLRHGEMLESTHIILFDRTIRPGWGEP
jgi:hypothetical protein